MSKRTHEEKVRRRRMLAQEKNQRTTRLLVRQRQRATLSKRDLYPDIVFLGGEADPRWVEIITRTLRDIDFEDRNYFSERDSLLCRLHKQLGAERLIGSLRDEADPKAAILSYWYPSLLGDVLFKRMTPEDWRVCPIGRKSKGPLAIHDVNVCPRGERFEVTFSSLRQGPNSSYGTRKTHGILVDTEPARTFFSEHAIEQTQARLTPSTSDPENGSVLDAFRADYAGWGDIYAFFDNCRYFERCLLPNGTPALSFFADCFVDQSSRYVAPFMTNLAEAIVGPAIHAVTTGVRWYYRVGYAPAVRHGDLWLLKTVLPPGYDGTPEHASLQRASMPADQKLQMLQKLNGWTADSLVGTSDYELTQWFHENARPQVVAFEGDLFADQVPGRTLRTPNRVDARELARHNEPGRGK